MVSLFWSRGTGSYHCITQPIAIEQIFPTEKLKTTFYSYVVTLGARKSTGLTWTCFQFHLKSYTAIQLVGELVCRVQGGNSHTSSFLAGMAGRLASACSSPEQHGTDVVRHIGWLRAPRGILPGDPGRCHKASEPQPQKSQDITPATFYWSSQSLRPAQSWRRGIRLNRKTRKDFVASLIYHGSIIQILLS